MSRRNDIRAATLQETMRQGEYMTDAQRRETKRRRVVWDLLRQYFNHLKARLTPGSQELVEKVEQQASSETTKDNDAP